MIPAFANHKAVPNRIQPRRQMGLVDGGIVSIHAAGGAPRQGALPRASPERGAVRVDGTSGWAAGGAFVDQAVDYLDSVITSSNN